MYPSGGGHGQGSGGFGGYPGQPPQGKCTLGVQKMRLTVFKSTRGLWKAILHKNMEHFSFRNVVTYCPV